MSRFFKNSFTVKSDIRLKFSQMLIGKYFAREKLFAKIITKFLIFLMSII